MKTASLPSSLAQRILSAVQSRYDEDILFVQAGIPSLKPSSVKKKSKDGWTPRKSLNEMPDLGVSRYDCSQLYNDESNLFLLRERNVTKTIWAQFTALVQKKILELQYQRTVERVAPKCENIVKMGSNDEKKDEKTQCASFSRSYIPQCAPASCIESRESWSTLQNIRRDKNDILLVLCCRETFFACITEASCLLLSIQFCVLNPSDPIKRQDEILHRLRFARLPSGNRKKRAEMASFSAVSEAGKDEKCCSSSNNYRNLIIWRDEDIQDLLQEAERQCREIKKEEKKESVGTTSMSVGVFDPRKKNTESFYSFRAVTVNQKLNELMCWKYFLDPLDESGLRFQDIFVDEEKKKFFGKQLNRKVWNNSAKNVKEDNSALTVANEEDGAVGDEDELAYIIFTSGSSGPKPKGVMNTVGNLSAYYDDFCCHENGLQVPKVNSSNFLKVDGSNDAHQALILPRTFGFLTFLTLSTPFFDPSIGDMLCTVLTPRPWMSAQICISSESLLDPSLLNRLVLELLHPRRFSSAKRYFEGDKSCLFTPIPTHIISTPAVWQLLTQETADLLQKWWSGPKAASYREKSREAAPSTKETTIREEGGREVYSSVLSSASSLRDPCFVNSVIPLRLFLGGEKMTSPIVDRWASIVFLYSIYGVTEATIYQAVSSRLLHSQRGHETSYTFLGRNKSHIEKLDDNDSDAPADPLDMGTAVTSVQEKRVGEIVLCGPQVALGYLPDPRSDDEFPDSSKFFTCSACGKRGFRTGDIGFFCIDGDTTATLFTSGSSLGEKNDGRNPPMAEDRDECLSSPSFSNSPCLTTASSCWKVSLQGRKDFQTKINGQRVSVEEVESALQTLFKDVFRCVCGFCIPVETRMEGGGDCGNRVPQVMLCVYGVLRNTTKLCTFSKLDAPSNKLKMEEDREREELLGRLSSVWESLAATVLPPYMVPRLWFVEEVNTAIPYTATGKIHRFAICEKWKKKDQGIKTVQIGGTPERRSASALLKTSISPPYNTPGKGEQEQTLRQALSPLSSSLTDSGIVRTAAKEGVAPAISTFDAIYNVVQEVWQLIFGLSSCTSSPGEASLNPTTTRGREKDTLAPHTSFYNLGGDSLGALKVTREVYLRLGGTEEGIDPFGRLPPPFQPFVLLQHPRLSDYVQTVVQMLRAEDEKRQSKSSTRSKKNSTKLDLNDEQMLSCCRMPNEKNLGFKEKGKEEEKEVAARSARGVNFRSPISPSLSPSSSRFTLLGGTMNDKGSSALSSAFPPRILRDFTSTCKTNCTPFNDLVGMNSAFPHISEDSFQAILEFGEPNLLSLVLREGLYDVKSSNRNDSRGGTSLWGCSSSCRVVRTAPTPLHTLVNLYHLTLAREEEVETKECKKQSKLCSVECLSSREDAARDFSPSFSPSFVPTRFLLSSRYLEMMRVLIKEFNVKVTPTTPDGVTPAHLAASRNKRVAYLSVSPPLVVGYVLASEKQDNLDILRCGSCTASAMCFSSCCTILSASRSVGPLRLLVDSGCPLSVRDRRGQTLLHFAARAGHVEAVGYILWCCGAAFPVSSSAAESPSFERMCVLLCNRDKWQRTPAHWAALNGHLDVLQLMLLAFRSEEENETQIDHENEESIRQRRLRQLKGKRWKENRKKVACAKEHYTKQASKRTHLVYETITDIVERLWCGKNACGDADNICSLAPKPLPLSADERSEDHEERSEDQEKHLEEAAVQRLLDVCTELGYWIEAA